MAETQPRIIDYGQSTYEQDFWAKGREYEDLADRAALRRLLPAYGKRLMEVGAGHGRLVPLYNAFSEVVLLDYSAPMLADAHSRHGAGRLRYASANWYRMPFVDGAFDTVVAVRVLHHAEDLPRLFREVARVLAPGGAFVLEFANKRNFKALLRKALGRQRWNPLSEEPVEFYPMHWDFHPRYVSRLLTDLGFAVESQLAVSHFRAALLKRLLPATWLARADAALQPIGRWMLVTPSVFLRATAPGVRANVAAAVFRCPRCGSALLETDALTCPACDARWERESGVYDLKSGPA